MSPSYQTEHDDAQTYRRVQETLAREQQSTAPLTDSERRAAVALFEFLTPVVQDGTATPSIELMCRLAGVRAARFLAATKSAS